MFNPRFAQLFRTIPFILIGFVFLIDFTYGLFHPAITAVLIFCICVCSFPVRIKRSTPLYTLHDTNFILILQIPLLILCLFAQHFYSDDVLRHVHDGFYLLQGVDIYRFTPLDLGNQLEPNHPFLGSIYFPLTQIMAALGAMVSTHYGFMILFLLVIGLASLYVTTSRHDSTRRSYLLFLSLPFFWISALSFHGDFFAFVLILLAWSFYKQRMLFFAGIVLGLLPGLKPEGVLWTLIIPVFCVVQLGGKKTISLALGILLSIGLISIPTILFIQRHPDSVTSFLETIHIYFTWYLNTNPIPDLLHFFLEWPVDESIRFWRWIAIPLFLSLGYLLSRFLLPQYLILREGLANKSVAKSTTASSCPYSAASTSSFLWKTIGILPGWRLDRAKSEPAILFFLLLTLAALFFFRGTWQPWYFLWIVAVLIWMRRIRLAWMLFSVLPLFYIPVSFYRAAGIFHPISFYFACLGFIGVFVSFYLTRKSK